MPLRLYPYVLFVALCSAAPVHGNTECWAADEIVFEYLYPPFYQNWISPCDFWPDRYSPYRYKCRRPCGYNMYGYPWHLRRYTGHPRESENLDLKKRLRYLGEPKITGYSRARGPLRIDPRLGISRYRSLSSFELRQAAGRRW
jgi:hypothetical protein